MNATWRFVWWVLLLGAVLAGAGVLAFHVVYPDHVLDATRPERSACIQFPPSVRDVHTYCDEEICHLRFEVNGRELDQFLKQSGFPAGGWVEGLESGEAPDDLEWWDIGERANTRSMSSSVIDRGWLRDDIVRNLTVVETDDGTIVVYVEAFHMDGTRWTAEKPEWQSEYRTCR